MCGKVYVELEFHAVSPPAALPPPPPSSLDMCQRRVRRMATVCQIGRGRRRNLKLNARLSFPF